MAPAAPAVVWVVKRLESSAATVHCYIMTTPLATDHKVVDPALLGDEEPADEIETRAHLLARAKRQFAPIYKGFVQNPDRKAANRAGPLAQFVRNGDLRGLRAILFLHAIISSGDGDNGWSTTLPLSVWARVFDTTKAADRRSASTAATKVISRLAGRNLVTRKRSGSARAVTVRLLRPDGSGDQYTRPDGKSDRFLKLSNSFWTDRWYEQLDLPATAMLLVALHEKPGFELATERMPEWYGFSADTAERGLKTLQDKGLLHVHKRVRKTPLSPTGATQVNVYTLLEPFQVQAADPSSALATKSKKKAGAARKTGAKRPRKRDPLSKLTLVKLPPRP